MPCPAVEVADRGVVELFDMGNGFVDGGNVLRGTPGLRIALDVPGSIDFINAFGNAWPSGGNTPNCAGDIDVVSGATVHWGSLDSEVCGPP